MLSDKTLRLIGLSRGSGGAACGASALIAAIKRKKCFLAFIARDCGTSTFDKFINMCSEHKIPVILCDSKQILGSAAGYGEKAVLGITNAAMAQGILAQEKENIFSPGSM